MDRALCEVPDQWDWSLESGTHERFKDVKTAWPLMIFEPYKEKMRHYNEQ